MSDNNSTEVFEPPVKPKRKRKPLTEEQKEALRERLRLARESKKKKNITMSVTPVEVAPDAPVVEPLPPIIKEQATSQVLPNARVSVDKPSNEMKQLQDQINSMKLEKLEALEKKNEKKKAAIEKRRATIARKALEKASKNVVAKPAKERKPTVAETPMEPIAESEAEAPMEVDWLGGGRAAAGTSVPPPKKARYSTFKRSVWSTL